MATFYYGTNTSYQPRDSLDRTNPQVTIDEYRPSVFSSRPDDVKLN